MISDRAAVKKMFITNVQYKLGAVESQMTQNIPGRLERLNMDLSGEKNCRINV